MKSYLALALISFTSFSGYAETLYEQFPGEIHADEKYVFYSHGFIVEGSDPIPVHPEYGKYDFPAVTQSLFEIGGFNLIAHHRPANTDIGDYVDSFESWVNALLEAGVEPSNIVLIGFSRGSLLTALTSSRFSNSGIKTILMAVCYEGDIASDPTIQLGGNLLSIYVTTDRAGDCNKLAARSELDSFDEIQITTGKSHGAFYLPREEWLNPIQNWLSEVESY